LTESQHPDAQSGHVSVPPQPFPLATVPHSPAAQVIGVQPQMPGVPPPPQVSGAVQLLFDVHPQAPDTHAVPAAELVQFAHAPPTGPQVAGAVSAVWQVVPSQQAPLQTSPPLQAVLQVFAAEQAFPVGQSPAAPQPHVPPSWQTCPALCVEQSVHAPPLTPQSVPPAAPVWQVPPVRSQHPVLHSRVTPPTTHVPLHECVVVLQAWLVGQSVTELQPQAPAMHSLAPEQGPHAAPAVPHCVLDVFVTQLPVASQQPLGHEVGVHVETHDPAEQIWLVPHGVHDVPPVPHVAVDDVSHCPVAEQHPAAQVVGVHGTLASPPASAVPPSSPPASLVPLSGAPLSVGAASATASTVPSAGASCPVVASPAPSVVPSTPPSGAPWPPSAAASLPASTEPSLVAPPSPLAGPSVTLASPST
jgi:hypothetical protein